VSELVEKKELTEEEIIGEQLSKEYIEKVDFKKSAEVKMFAYVVVAAAVMVIIAVIASQFTK
jgi:hypothetical protein